MDTGRGHVLLSRQCLRLVHVRPRVVTAAAVDAVLYEVWLQGTLLIGASVPVMSTAGPLVAFVMV